MQSISAVYRPQSNYTPSQRKEADRRRDRLAKIAANAQIDIPISCPSASQRANVEAAANLLRTQHQPARRAVAAIETSAQSESEPTMTPLNHKSTMANLVSYRSAMLAHAAIRQLCDPDHTKAPMFNPLYLHSKTGLGKTHLLQAVTVEYRAAGINACYLDADTISRMCTRSADLDGIFLRDALIVDDIDQLQGRYSKNAVAGLVSKFSSLDKPVVVSASVRANDLDGFDDRAMSRLNGGLVVEIGAPDREARLEFLAQRMRGFHNSKILFDLPECVIGYLADKITVNFRDLEAATNRLLSLQRSGETITVDACAAAVFDLTKPTEPQPPRIEEIQRAVCRHYGVSRNDLLSPRRTALVVRPRQVAMYLSKTLTLRSLPEIGRRFGNRDHTTILSGVRKMTRLLQVDTDLAATISSLTVELGGCNA